jgi:hypothetical protein
MMKKEQIKVGFCIAYDWYFLEDSLPLIYQEADIICLSIDINRVSWSGNKFEFDESGFLILVKRLDTANKIQIYQDNFYVPELSPMQNEVRQRNKIAEFMKPGGWHIQLDSDEYFLHFDKFVSFLQHSKFKRPVNICCPWINLFKKLDNGFLIISNKAIKNQNFMAIATNVPHYEFSRRNGYFNIKTDFAILHQSWARSNNEIRDKINNWGHKEDFDSMDFYSKWEQLNENNYTSYKNLNPISPEAWESLSLLKSRNIQELITEVNKNPPFIISKFYLRLESNIWYSRFKVLMKKLRIRW